MTIEQVKQAVQKITGKRLARAQDALAAGVALVTDRQTGRKFAVVGSTSGAGSYTVTGRGCSCKGYAHRSYCCHSDAVHLTIIAKQEAAAAAASPEFPAMRVERQPNGDTHIVNAETGELAGILSPIDVETDEPAPADVSPEFEQWLADMEIAETPAVAFAPLPTLVGRTVEQY